MGKNRPEGRSRRTSQVNNRARWHSLRFKMSNTRKNNNGSRLERDSHRRRENRQGTYRSFSNHREEMLGNSPERRGNRRNTTENFSPVSNERRENHRNISGTKFKHDNLSNELIWMRRESEHNRRSNESTNEYDTDGRKRKFDGSVGQDDEWKNYRYEPAHDDDMNYGQESFFEKSDYYRQSYDERDSNGKYNEENDCYSNNNEEDNCYSKYNEEYLYRVNNRQHGWDQQINSQNGTYTVSDHRDVKRFDAGNVLTERSQCILNHELPPHQRKEDLVSDLLDSILENGGEITTRDLQINWKSRWNNEQDLKLFLEKYPQVFEFDYENSATEEPGEVGDSIELVRAKTRVKLCPTHSKQPRTCQGDCNSLHLCRFHILSRCPIQKCKFNHDISDKHNIRVQENFYLHRLKLQNLRLLLQHDANRCSVTVPIVCKFYNEGKCTKNQNRGDEQQQKCRFLHICSDFLEGRCNEWKCRLNHNLREESVLEIICMYGLNPDELADGCNRVFKLLKWSVNDFKEQDKNDQTVRYMSTTRKTGEGALAKQYLKRKAIRIKNENGKRQKMISSINDHQLNREQNKLKVIASILEGNDADLETVTSKSEPRIPTTFWSILKNNTKQDVSLKNVKILEEKYQNYISSKTAVIIVDGKEFEVDFAKFEGKYLGTPDVFKVDRSRTKESIEDITSESEVDETSDDEVTNDCSSSDTATESERSAGNKTEKNSNGKIDLNFIKI